MKIRPYQTKDKEAIIQLFRSNIPQYFDPSEEAGLIDYLDNQLEDYFVLEEQGNVIGAGGINYTFQDKTACLSWDIIKPEFHGKGLGRRLCEHRLKHIQQQPEIERVEVRTAQNTFRFYEKMGFKLIRVVEDYWAKGYDLYEMALEF